MAKTVRFNFRISANLSAKLNELATTLDLSAGEVIRRLIERATAEEISLYRAPRETAAERLAAAIRRRA